MSTVNHVRRSNIPLEGSASNTAFRAFWELTRLMQKAGWKYRASSDGTAKDTTGDPNLDKWAAGGLALLSGSGASIGTPSRGRATVSGLAGMTAADKGRFISISGSGTAANNNRHQIEEVLSATSVRIDARNFAVAADAGPLSWLTIETLALGAFASYTAPNAIGWWVAQGPSVLKIPITAASAGTFRRGENVVQATTGAEGELVGYTFYNGAGWLVIAPRLRGTGSGQHGWDTANVITGAKSGATVTQVGSALDYVYEICFIKPANQTTMQIFAIQADRVGESAELFSVLATSAGCTATVHPGGGGTGNAFPTHAWVTWGTSTTAGTGSVISGTSGTNIPINAHVICVDAIPEQNYSADGSWMLSLFTHHNNANSTACPSAVLYGLQRLNDTEDGEVSLYASVSPVAAKTNGANVRTSAGTIVTDSTALDQCSFGQQDVQFPNTTYGGMYAGWKARGLTGESYAEFNPASQLLAQTQAYVQNQFLYAQRMQASAHPAVKPREKIWMTYAATRGYKGSFRWLYWVNGGQLGDVFGGDPGWTQLSYGLGANGSGTSGLAGAVSGGGAMVMGPHDGSPVFIQSAGG